MATQTDFDELTTHAMGEIAALLLIARDARSMYATFKNSPELDVNHAGQHVKKVVDFTSTAARGLLASLFRGKGRRESSLRSARLRFAKRLPAVIQSAEVLAEMEVEAISPVGGKGNVFRLRVVRPLQQLNW